MLQRLTRAATLDQFAQSVHFGRRKFPAKLQIKLHAWEPEQMSEEQFDIQALRFDTPFGQEVGAALYNFKNGHAYTISLNPRLQSSKCRLHSATRNPIFGT